MVSSMDFFSKSLKDELMVSRGVPGPRFPIWDRLLGKTFWGKWPKTPGKLQTQHFGDKILGDKREEANFSDSFSEEIPQVTPFSANSDVHNPMK